MKKVIILVGMVILTSFAPRNEKMAAVEVVVIVNGENPIEKLFPTEIRNYWMKRGTFKAWTSTKAVVMPVDRKGQSPEKSLFYKKIISLSEADVESYFSAKQYQNAENPPVKFSSDREIIDYVSENKGAIGFVNAASISSDTKVKVKIAYTIAE